MNAYDRLIEQYEQLSIGDTATKNGHEYMWDGGRWVPIDDGDVPCERADHHHEEVAR